MRADVNVSISCSFTSIKPHHMYRNIFRLSGCNIFNAFSCHIAHIFNINFNLKLPRICVDLFKVPSIYSRVLCIYMVGKFQHVFSAFSNIVREPCCCIYTINCCLFVDVENIYAVLLMCWAWVKDIGKELYIHLIHI